MWAGRGRGGRGFGKGVNSPSPQVPYKPLDLELAQLFLELAGEVRRGWGLGVSGQMMLSPPLSLCVLKKEQGGYPGATLYPVGHIGLFQVTQCWASRPELGVLGVGESRFTSRVLFSVCSGNAPPSPLLTLGLCPAHTCFLWRFASPVRLSPKCLPPSPGHCGLPFWRQTCLL